jgi:hypothetical protein
VLTSRVVWEAEPILVSGGTEPEWPTLVGGTVVDNTIAWRAISRRIEDERCPQSKVVAIAASKIFAADNDIIAFSATVNPLDWSTPDDAGYIPFGLNTYGSNPVTALGLYRGNLIAFNSEAFQMWQVDQDPANMAILDAVPVSCTFPHSVQSVANDLVFCNPVGIRNINIAGASTNLQAGQFGEAVDPLVTAKINAAEFEPLGLYYPARGQYWLLFGPEAFVLTINGTKDQSWSRYVFPEEITDWTLHGDQLYLRTSTGKVWHVTEDALQDDMYSIGNPPVLSGEALDGAYELTWTEYDPEGGADLLYYALYRSVGEGSEAFVRIGGDLPAEPRLYLDGGPFEPNEYYNYRIVAVDARGVATGPSNVVTYRAPPVVTYFTSQPYACVLVESLDVTGAVLGSVPSISGQEFMDISGTLDGGQLKSLLLDYSEYPPEAMDITGTIDGGELVIPTTLTYDAGAEAMGISGSLLSGVLSDALVTYSNYPVEALSIDGSLLSGELS